MSAEVGSQAVLRAQPVHPPLLYNLCTLLTLKTVPLAPLRNRPRRARSVRHNRHSASRDQRAAQRSIPDQDSLGQVIAGGNPHIGTRTDQKPSGIFTQRTRRPAATTRHHLDRHGYLRAAGLWLRFIQRKEMTAHGVGWWTAALSICNALFSFFFLVQMHLAYTQRFDSITMQPSCTPGCHRYCPIRSSRLLTTNHHQFLNFRG
jgi:hypothetical protein